MMELIILIISSILVFSGVPSTAEEPRFKSGETDSEESEDYVSRAWSAFKTQYGKSYSSIEDQRRRLIFEESLKIVQSHNYLYETGRSTYEMGINKFSDMEFAEIRKMTGYVKSNAAHSKIGVEFSPSSDSRVPDSIDWRERGYVTEVKSQGECESSWAFSATGSLEGQTKNKTGKLVSLSEQNLVDCSRAEGNRGCVSGDAIDAFIYILDNGGIDTEACYPYEALDNNTCRYKPECRGATVQGYAFSMTGSEEALIWGIANVGPISAVINVIPSFDRYKSGIYEDSNCTAENYVHSVLAVGYGTLIGKEYYIVKNSWGTEWGNKGYILMARNKGNICGIATYASYPIV